MSDNKTPIYIVLGIIEERISKLENELDDSHEFDGIHYKISENKQFIQTLKSHLAIEEEANRNPWINLTERNPDCWESGNWDGLRSDFVLTVDKHGCYKVARMYEGFLDGTNFAEFYDESDFEIKDVVRWQKIKEI